MHHSVPIIRLQRQAQARMVLCTEWKMSIALHGSMSISRLCGHIIAAGTWLCIEAHKLHTAKFPSSLLDARECLL